MAKDKWKGQTIRDLHITDMVAEGNSLGRHENKVVFVKYGAPGDVLDVKVTRSKSSFAEAEIINIVTPSSSRVEPLCSHFGVCGGCKWQHLTYAEQVVFKHQQVLDALERIAKVDFPTPLPIVPSPVSEYYRNKLEYTFTNSRWLTYDEIKTSESFERRGVGFHIPGFFDKVLDVERCHLQEDISNRIRNSIKQYALEHDLTFFDLRAQVGLLRNLIVRTSTTNELMVIVQFFEPNESAINGLMNHLKTSFPEITSLLYIVNQKKNETIFDQDVITFSGAPYIHEKMEDLTFRIGPKSFFQTNSVQALKLYQITREFADLKPHERVYDLYTGTGTIANFIARSCKEVIGVEYVDMAIEDAKINAQLNSINNARFFAGDMKDVLTDAFVKEQGYPDVIILDPPRAGVHDSVIDTILRIAPKRIVYVSCNPATQARDLQLLDKAYVIEKVQPVDMFPHTAHVENVVALKLRS